VAGAAKTGPAAQDANVIQFVKNPEGAPAFQLNDLEASRSSLAEATGKIVLLNFWATGAGRAAQSAGLGRSAETLRGETGTYRPGNG